MKKNLMAIALIGLMLCNTYKSFSQATTAGNANNPVGADYLGWANGNAIPLKIQNINAQPIEFYTGTGPTKYMTLLGSTNPGFLGIGIATPRSLVHLDAGSLQITNSTTGNGGNNVGLTLGQAAGSLTAEINNQSNGAMKLMTNNSSRIFIDNGGGNGYVAIGTGFTAPTSRLHIRENTGSVDTWLQLTSNSTTHNAGNGLRIGVLDASKDVEIKQQENADLNFYTNATQKAVIKASGKVGVGLDDPNSLLHVHDGLIQISNSTTTAGAHGFTIGQNNADVQLKQLENANISFFTHNGTSVAERMRLSAIGDLSVGTSNAGNNRLKAEVVSGDGSAYQNAILGNNSEDVGTGEKCGVRGECTSVRTSSYNNIGGHFLASGNSGTNTVNAGVMGEATGSSTTQFVNAGFFLVTAGSGIDNKGVFGEASTSSGTNNFGVYGKASGGSTINYGVYATGGTACTTTGCAAAAGYFSGSAYAVNGFYSSDQMLKENIQEINHASEILAQLSPKTYNFRSGDFPSMHLDEGNQYGLIAQDVEQILPELVRSFKEPAVIDENGNVTPEVSFKALNYNQLIPLLIAGFKEQQQRITDLETTIAGCCAQQRTTGDEGTNKATIELQNLSTLQLLQNDPNPFSESTFVRWNIPNDFTNAVLYFYDQSGNQINTYKVNAKGAGELQIFGSKLSSGIYTYTLVVDGKVMDTKKMVKAAQ